MIVDEILEVLLLVGIDTLDGFLHGAVEARVGVGIDLVGSHFGAVVEGRTDDAAAILFRERNIGLGQRRGFDLSTHHRIIAIARARRRRNDLDEVARQEAAEKMQREIMRAGIEGHADRLVGELLRRIDVRIRTHHDGRISHDGAAAKLARTDAGVFDAAIIAPFAGVIHVRLALLEQLAVAAEGIDAKRIALVLGDRLHAGLVAVGPFDLDALALKSPSL